MSSFYREFYKEKNNDYLINSFLEAYDVHKNTYGKNKNSLKHVLRHEKERGIITWSLESEYNLENDRIICELFLKSDGKAFLNLLQQLENYLEDC